MENDQNILAKLANLTVGADTSKHPLMPKSNSDSAVFLVMMINCYAAYSLKDTAIIGYDMIQRYQYRNYLLILVALCMLVVYVSQSYHKKSMDRQWKEIILPGVMATMVIALPRTQVMVWSLEILTMLFFVGFYVGLTSMTHNGKTTFQNFYASYDTEFMGENADTLWGDNPPKVDTKENKEKSGDQEDTQEPKPSVWKGAGIYIGLFNALAFAGMVFLFHTTSGMLLYASLVSGIVASLSMTLPQTIKAIDYFFGKKDRQKGEILDAISPSAETSDAAPSNINYLKLTTMVIASVIVDFTCFIGGYEFINRLTDGKEKLLAIMVGIAFLIVSVIASSSVLAFDEIQSAEKAAKEVKPLTGEDYSEEQDASEEKGSYVTSIAVVTSAMFSLACLVASIESIHSYGFLNIPSADFQFNGTDSASSLAFYIICTALFVMMTYAHYDWMKSGFEALLPEHEAPKSVAVAV